MVLFKPKNKRNITEKYDLTSPPKKYYCSNYKYTKITDVTLKLILTGKARIYFITR